MRADMADARAVRRILERLRPSVIVIAAGYTDVDGCEKNRRLARHTNVLGPRRVAQISRRMGARVIHLSTDYVFDGRKRTPYTERDLCRPLNHYARTKRQGELAVLRAAPGSIVLRTSWIYGRARRNFVDQVLASGRQKRPIVALSDQWGVPTSARELGEAVAVVAEKIVSHDALSGIYHATQRGRCSRVQLVRTILKCARLRAPIIQKKVGEFFTTAPRPVYTPMSNRKFERTFGFRFSHWKDALKSYIRENA